MTSLGDDHERTMAFAEIALGQIRALRQSASPRNYEVWYNYATGYHPALNEAVNALLAEKQTLDDADIQAIYDAHLSPTRLSDRLDNVGSRVVDEIEQVMAMVEAAVGTASSYSESLVGVSQQLSTADRDGLRAIVQSLVQTAKEMEQVNKKLEERLHLSKQEIHRLQANLEAVRTESLTDPLTSLANRKFFDDALARAIDQASHRGEHLALMLADVDHFKTFNDSYGHLTGDQVLRLVALSIKQNVKGQDITARYGGEEFAVILPDTILRSAVAVADHIRRAVMNKELMKRSTGEHLGRVTISIGVAALRLGDDPRSLIARADTCLYAAKRNGRNCVICETDLPKPNTATQVA
jgi:diguanylate cyclase